MQFSIAHNAVDEFVGFIGDPYAGLKDEFDKELVEQLPKGRLWVGYVSDWLHLWLLSGLGHRACMNDPVAYISAVVLVYAEFATTPELFEGGNIKGVPPMPESLVTDTMGEEANYVSSPEFLIPISLTPAGFEFARLPDDETRRAVIPAFIENPEWYRYGFHAYRYFPPHYKPATK